MLYYFYMHKCAFIHFEKSKEVVHWLMGQQVKGSEVVYSKINVGREKPIIYAFIYVYIKVKVKCYMMVFSFLSFILCAEPTR